MNDFNSDNQWQLEQRDSILKPLFYDWHFHDRYKFCDDMRDYQERGIDTIITSGIGKTIHVEEKIVRKQHTAFALETKSCTVEGHEKSGWMFYSEADRLLYCFKTNE